MRCWLSGPRPCVSSPTGPERIAASNGPKAWRFVGEMEQLAAGFADAKLPDGFCAAAGEIYERLARCKDHENVTLDDILALLTD